MRALFKPLPVLLGWRYLVTRDVGLSFVTHVATIGLAISVAVLLLVLAIMSGFQRHLMDSLLSHVPHVHFQSESGIDAEVGGRIEGSLDSVIASEAVIQTSGMVVREDRLKSAQFLGIETESFDQFAGIERFASEGKWNDLKAGEFGVFLGSMIAKELGVTAGDSVLLVTSHSDITPIGFFPRQKRFRVLGAIQTDSLLDSLSIYVHREDLQRVLKVDFETNSLLFRLQDPFLANRVVFEMLPHLDTVGLSAGTWQGLFGSLYVFLRQFKNMLFLILALLIGVAAFNLVSSMVMFVQSRRDDVAVLRTLGSSSPQVLCSFLLIGLAIALVGVVVGGFLAWLIGLALPTLHVWVSNLLGVSLSDGFLLHRITVDIRADDWLRVAALAIGSVLVGSAYPAWRATQLEPSEVLRDE